MSRIGNKIIQLPAGVTVNAENCICTVSGPKGTLKQDFDKNISVNVENNVVTLTRANDEFKAKHGLYRALIANMVKGVSEGFTKALEINGVGFKVQVVGTKLVMNIGFSHPVEIEAPVGVKFECPTITSIKISGIDKQAVGQAAAMIRAVKKVEPYHAYGIRYSDEVVVRKVGKTAGKGKK